MTRPIQRVGHIGYDDNQFCGAAVFGELAHTVVAPTDLVARAFGMPALSDDDREVVRLMTLCLTSPDARVWPLKLTRVLASYGNPVAGFFGAQLGNAGDRMGPGTATHATQSLVWIRDRVGDEPTPEAVAAAIAEHTATRGRIAGFGVPFRPQDERLLGMYRLIAGHSATRRPYYRLHLLVADAMRATEGLEPNIVLAIAALLLDLGLPAHRGGMFLGAMMTHTFIGHALEAADDGALLRELPSGAIEDRSAAPRRSPAAAEAAAAGRGGTAQFAPRRSLAW